MSSPAPLHVFQLSTLAEFRSLRRGWNNLAGGVPMRTWEWNATWWQHYGNPPRSRIARQNAKRCATPLPGNELYLLAVFDADVRLVGVAPWYIATAANEVRTLRFLGSGEVCTDYSTVLCQPGYETEVAQALARNLCDPLHMADWLPVGHVRHWDRIHWDSVATDDLMMNLLIEQLELHGQIVHRKPADHCWRLALPDTWDGYLSLLSKSNRKKNRRLEREQFDTGRVAVRWVETAEQLPAAWDTLVRLHQARQQSQGNAGVFSSPSYTAFHRQLAEQLLLDGKLWLSVLELEGKPVAAEYFYAGDDTLYAYQGGIDPAALDDSPGRLSLIAMVRRAIDRGIKHLDFLRGDEPYKTTWGAQPHAMRQVRVVPPTATNRVRRGLWVATDQVRHWWKKNLTAR
jgi:hypothetical protein